MNPDFNDNFDRQMRQLHADAVAHVSPRTLARLRAARHEATRNPPARSGFRWHLLVATVLPAVLAVAIGLQFAQLTQTQAPAPTTDSFALDAYADPATDLDENPDLFLWLASSEALPLAME